MAGTFLYSLAGGMLTIVATGKPGQIAWRFLRIVGLLVFVLICVVTVWYAGSQDAAQSSAQRWSYMLGIAAGVASLGVVFLAPFVLRIPGIFRLFCGLGGLAGLAAGCLAAINLPGDMHSSFSTTVMIIISQVLGAMLLGSITIAWLLGHAYLTATKMTIAPLRHFSRLLLWSVAVRLAFLLVTVPTAYSLITESWLIITLRVGVGLVAVAVFAYMVADCVRLRATQSATGILYFGSIFAYIGELSNVFLIAEYGRPI